MRTLEFVCPRCREKIRAEVEERSLGTGEDTVLLQCAQPGGCGWFGYLPQSRGVAIGPDA